MKLIVIEVSFIFPFTRACDVIIMHKRVGGWKPAINLEGFQSSTQNLSDGGMSEKKKKKKKDYTVFVSFLVTNQGR